jgi:hypothetical protein
LKIRIVSASAPQAACGEQALLASKKMLILEEEAIMVVAGDGLVFIDIA